jgi:large subunit ribosomal protein L29
MASAAELREMVDEELENRLSEAKQELFNLRFQHVTGQLDNYARLGEMKKEVARINTILRDREIAAAEAIQAAGTEAEETSGA